MKLINHQMVELISIIAAMGVTATECVVDEAHTLKRPRIPPPLRYRDTRISGSYDDNVQPRAPRAPDPERMSAAEAKRARKAAKFKREQSK